MTNKKVRLFPFVYLFFVFLAVFNLSGCCKYKKYSKKTTKRNFSESLNNNQRGNAVNSNSTSSGEFEGIDVTLDGELPLRTQDEQTSELYEKLNYANKMYKNSNYEGALREISRIQQNIKDDPYLHLQTWALAAMIYDKTGKTSRRKRAYTKMLEVMEEVKKDSRYKKAYEDGMLCQDLIASVTKKGDKKYGVFE